MQEAEAVGGALCLGGEEGEELAVGDGLAGELAVLPAVLEVVLPAHQDLLAAEDKVVEGARLGVRGWNGVYGVESCTAVEPF